MGKYYALLGEYDSTTDTWTPLAGGAGASPYAPTINGKLTGLRVVVNRDAATSLIDHVQFRLTCSVFRPVNSIECGGQGSGIQTAPAFQCGMGAVTDWDVDQEIQAGVPIIVEGRNVGADTQVTPSVLLYGRFEG